MGVGGRAEVEFRRRERRGEEKKYEQETKTKADDKLAQPYH